MEKWLLILGLSLISSSWAIEKVTLDGKKFRQIATKEDIPIADGFYHNKQYQEAFDLYQQLAFNGEKFSQYMLSTMYLDGLGVNKDPLMAFAWAYNAKEDGNPKLQTYFKSLSSSLSPEQEKAAELIRMEIFAKYGNAALAYNMQRWIKRSMPRCSSSRIRGNVAACAQIRVVCNEISDDMTESVGFSNTHNYGKDCNDSARYRSGEYVHNLHTELKEVKKYIKAIEGTVTVERVQ